MADLAWVGATAWAALYCSDYYLTLACARLYAPQDKIKFEGSYELNPLFEAEVDALKRLSPSFVAILIVSTMALFFLEKFTEPEMHDFYLFMLGSVLLMQLTIHVRHLRNWLLFRHAISTDAITGHLEYRRSILLRASAFEILEFGVLYAFIYAFTPAGPFALGGAFGCALSAIGQYRLARTHNRPAVRTS